MFRDGGRSRRRSRAMLPQKQVRSSSSGCVCEWGGEEGGGSEIAPVLWRVGGDQSVCAWGSRLGARAECVFVFWEQKLGTCCRDCGRAQNQVVGGVGWFSTVVGRRVGGGVLVCRARTLSACVIVRAHPLFLHWCFAACVCPCACRPHQVRTARSRRGRPSASWTARTARTTRTARRHPAVASSARRPQEGLRARRAPLAPAATAAAITPRCCCRSGRGGCQRWARTPRPRVRMHTRACFACSSK